MVNVSISEKRNPKPQKITIAPDTTITSWGAIKINKSHFFPSSFQIKSGNKIIYIDPVEVDTCEKADFLLLTHSHPDHFSIKDIKKLISTGTEIVCPKSVSKKMKHFDNIIHVMSPGETLKLGWLKLEASAAYNTRSVFLWIKAHPKTKENIGFILTLNNGMRVYHAGDTDYVPEMNELTDIHLALVPIGGDNLTMNEAEAAQIINQIRPELVLPMHYEIKNIEELIRFSSLVDESVKIIEPE